MEKSYLGLEIILINLKLPKNIEEKVLKLFRLIDTDNSKSIDRAETLKFWSKNFPKLNSNELFTNVDKNDDNDIQEEEWLEFWTRVLGNHKQDEISEEVSFI